jgi:protein-tyrosine phosphatase
MPHILVVCTANICRSPVGEAILRDRLHKRDLKDWTVDSAGTWALVGRGASRYGIELMARQGFDLQGHRARFIEERLLQEADLILCMELGHVEALRVEFPAYGNKVYLLAEMVGKYYSINDPYGGPMSEYESMVAELTNIIDDGLDRIIELAKTNAASVPGQK